MPIPTTFILSTFLEKHEIPFIWLLCLAACLRVAVFIAAFPLVLFLTLYLQGFSFLMAKFRLGRYRLVLLMLIFFLITAAEIALSQEVFGSPYNLFHLWSGTAR